MLLFDLGDDASSWSRRLVLIPWVKAPHRTNQISNFGERLLEEEGEGILNWCIEGAEKIASLSNEKLDFEFELPPIHKNIIGNRINESKETNSGQRFGRQSMKHPS